MADKAIHDLTKVTTVYGDDLFVLEQSGEARKLEGQTFISYLTAAADGHGGINNITYTAPASGSLNGTLTVTLADSTVYNFTITNGRGITNLTKSTSGLVDTYTFSYNDGTTSQFTVTNGRGISDFTKSTSGLVDTYTITYNDSTTSQMIVTNGRAIATVTDYWAVSSSDSEEPQSYSTTVPTLTPTNRYLWHYQVIAFNNSTEIETTHAVTGVYGDTGQAWYVWIKWADQQPTSDADMSDTPADWIGVYSGTATTAPTAYTAYTWFEYKGEKGDQGDPARMTAETGYQVSDSGTVIPTGEWSSTVPVVGQGYYLWTRTMFTIHNGDGTSSSEPHYSVTRAGIDGGGGTVNSVNNQAVDPGTSNVTLNSTLIPISSTDNQNIKAYVDGLQPDSVTVTIASSDWSGTPIRAAKTILGMTGTRDVVVSPAPDSRELCATCGIAAVSQGQNSITFEASSLPNSSVTINLLMM